MQEERPSWQNSVCPAWCVRDHEEADRDGDRDHQAEGIYVPVIRLIKHFPPAVPTWRELVTEDVVVAAFQDQTDSHPTVLIGLSLDNTVALELRGESAERLHQALGQILNTLRLQG